MSTAPSKCTALLLRVHTLSSSVVLLFPLQESGVISMADLAITYSLNTELLRNIISTRMGSIILGQLDGSLLYTPAYVRNIKAQLRGALRGTAAPVALNNLIRDLGLDSFGSSNSMVAQLVDELLQEGAVSGSTKGGGGSWVPSIHTSAQQNAVAGFYQQNGWVAYDLVRKSGIGNEKSYLKQKFPEGIALDSGNCLAGATHHKPCLHGLQQCCIVCGSAEWFYAVMVGMEPGTHCVP